MDLHLINMINPEEARSQHTGGGARNGEKSGI